MARARATVEIIVYFYFPNEIFTSLLVSSRRKCIRTVVGKRVRRTRSIFAEPFSVSRLPFFRFVSVLVVSPITSSSVFHKNNDACTTVRRVGTYTRACMRARRLTDLIWNSRWPVSRRCEGGMVCGAECFCYYYITVYFYPSRPADRSFRFRCLVGR